MAPIGGTRSGAVSSGRARTKALPSTEILFGTLTTLMEQQKIQPAGGYRSIKALKGVVEKIGRFDAKNVTNFLKIYLREMEAH